MADFKLRHDISEHGIEKVCTIGRRELAPDPRWALLARDNLQKLKVSCSDQTRELQAGDVYHWKHSFS